MFLWALSGGCEKLQKRMFASGMYIFFSQNSEGCSIENHRGQGGEAYNGGAERMRQKGVGGRRVPVVD